MNLGAVRSQRTKRINNSCAKTNQVNCKIVRIGVSTQTRNAGDSWQQCQWDYLGDQSETVRFHLRVSREGKLLRKLGQFRAKR